MRLEDLDTLPAANAGSVMILREPTFGIGNVVKGDDGKPVWFKLRGSDSQAFRDARRINNQFQAQRAKHEVEATEEDGEEDAMRVLVACTVEWSSNLTLEGKLFACGPENARKLYSHPGWAWIATQARAFIMGQNNFLPKRSTASSGGPSTNSD